MAVAKSHQMVCKSLSLGVMGIRCFGNLGPEPGCGVPVLGVEVADFSAGSGGGG